METDPILIKDYTYELPLNRIAEYPLIHRDSSKLLHYEQGKISHKIFSQLPDLLTDNLILFFNNTKVIPARLLFEKETGATIEIFLLEPVLPSTLLASALSTVQRSTWNCAIGNVKRWKEGIVLSKKSGNRMLFARLMGREMNQVEFFWDPPSAPFAEVLQEAGAVPLPPYIKRSPELSDRERYQTVYSKVEGAVAAPTAGLHFTEHVLDQIRAKNIITDDLTLHVSAGTFLPVTVENAMDHIMHVEQIVIRRKNLENLLMPGKKAIAVGTTALRTLESLYWYGTLLLINPSSPFIIDKRLPYESDHHSVSKEDAFRAILTSMEHKGIDELTGSTSIFIYPGYQFRVCDGLITNFHQPGSTLLLLIAAMVGPEWKKIYQEALENGYRFLSYGDSSLLMP